MSFWNLFISFSKIGLFGFGGGLAMLPFIFQAAKALTNMTEEEFSNLVMLSQITPGPLAVNAATYVGFSYAGSFGAVVATFAVSAPAFILVIIFSTILEKNKENNLKEAVFCGIRPAASGLVAAATVIVSQNSLMSSELLEEIKKGFLVESLKFVSEKPFEAFEPFSVLIFLLSFIAVFVFKLSPLKLIVSVLIAAFFFSFI